ncbi:hypothetical protein ACVWWK_002294 [Bradyrhizobium sp. LB9.1b]
MKLHVAEELDVVGKKSVTRSEIGKAALCPDLVALENARVALDRFHQRAGLALLGRGALAEAAAAQAGPELVDVPGRRREIVVGEKIGVHRQIGLDPLEPRHHAGQRTDVFAVPRHGGSRRHGAVSAAGHDELSALGNLDRHCCPSWIPELLAAAGRALRAFRDVVLDDRSPGQVEARDMIAEISAKSGGDRLRDFNRSEVDPGLSYGVADQGRYRDRLRHSAVEKPLDLAIADHAIVQAGPAGALARHEHRSHQRKHAGRLDQQPGRPGGHAFAVQLGEPPLEVIVHKRDDKPGRPLGDSNPELAQRLRSVRSRL